MRKSKIVPRKKLKTSRRKINLGFLTLVAFMVFVLFVSYHNYLEAMRKHKLLLARYQELNEKIEQQKVLNQKLLEVIEDEKLRGNNFPQARQGASAGGQEAGR